MTKTGWTIIILILMTLIGTGIYGIAKRANANNFTNQLVRQSTISTGQLASATTSVTPGKYEVALPFTLTNTSLDSTTHTIELQPGQSTTFYIIIKETGQGMLQVQLAPKVVLAEQ